MQDCYDFEIRPSYLARNAQTQRRRPSTTLKAKIGARSMDHSFLIACTSSAASLPQSSRN
jgi:hypothetical protein